MSRFWSQLVRELSPYVPGEQPKIPDLVKLNTNESPFGPSPRAMAAIARRGGRHACGSIPIPKRQRCCARRWRPITASRPEQVFVGNGSDEVLAHAFAALLKQTEPLLFPDVTYSFYPVYCRLFGIAFQTVPLDAADAVRRRATTRAPAGAIILANPNAPTGVALRARGDRASCWPSVPTCRW